MRKIKLTVPGVDFRNLIIGILLFVLGVVVGQRYLEPGSFPLLKKTLSNATTDLVDTRTVSNLSTPDSLDEDIDFNQFWEVWQLLERDYIDPAKIDRQEMVYGAIRGMTAAVGDPYTMFLPPEQDKRAAEDLAGSFYGIGIELGYIDGILAVVAPLRGMPAEQAGIQAGDLILRVKDEAKNLDEETTDWSLSRAVDEIRGERGTKVQLTLLRPEANTEPFELSIPRDEIVIPSVELAFVEHNGRRVAHIILSRFGDRTEAEWDEAVSTILTEKKTGQVDGVLLDMRNNPGGYFDQAIRVASEFVRRGTIVSQKGRLTNIPYPAEGEARLTELPVVVLVNRGSASASEIVAGALRDLKETKLVGEQTFGKGTVQDRRHLSNGGGLHITIAKWLLPNGDNISDEGLPVTVEVQNNPETPEDEVVNRAIEEL